MKDWKAMFGIPILAVPVMLLAATLAHLSLIDFHTFLNAGADYASRHNPYPTDWARQTHWVYPAAAAGFFAPLAQLPFTAAAAIYLTMLVAATAGALWLLDIRDWRLYCLVAASPPFLSGLHVGALTSLLLLAVAAAWRWRDRRTICGLLIAAAIVAKLFLWPLLLWLLVSRRYQHAVWAAASGITVGVAGWAWIGFAGLTGYPNLLNRIASIGGPYSYQPAWQLFHAHTLDALELMSVVAALFYLVGARRLADRDGYALAILLALALSPIVWLHYFLLLIPAVAVRQSRLAISWFALLSFLVTARLDPHTHALIAFALLVALALPLRRNRAQRQIQVARADREIVAGVR